MAAELLYLANLLLLPGIGMLLLFGLAMRERALQRSLPRCHLRQTIAASLWAVALLALVTLGIVFAGGVHSPYTWLIVLLYLTVCHSTLVLLGIVGLAKAMAGQRWRYPLLGVRCDE